MLAYWNFSLDGKIAAMDLIFSLLLLLGAVTGLAWSALSSTPKRVTRLVDQGLLVLLTSLIAGRIGYVGLNWGYFSANPDEIIQVWLGGISGLGAAYGFIAGLLLAAWLYAEPVLALADGLLPLGIAFTAGGWLAAWWAGSAYGAQVDTWYAVSARAETGLWAMRFPTQLLGALLTLSMGVILDRLFRPETIPGLRAALGLLGAGLTFSALSLTRVDPLPLWRQVRLDTWAGLGLAAGAGLCLLFLSLVAFLRGLRRRKAGGSNPTV